MTIPRLRFLFLVCLELIECTEVEIAFALEIILRADSHAIPVLKGKGLPRDCTVRDAMMRLSPNAWRGTPRAARWSAQAEAASSLRSSAPPRPRGFPGVESSKPGIMKWVRSAQFCLSASVPPGGDFPSSRPAVENFPFS